MRYHAFDQCYEPSRVGSTEPFEPAVEAAFASRNPLHPTSRLTIRANLNITELIDRRPVLWVPDPRRRRKDPLHELGELIGRALSRAFIQSKAGTQKS